MPIQILKEIEQEITHFLSDLISINTTNPPGNETKAATYIAKDIEKESLRAKKKNIIKDVPKEREKQKSYERER